MSVLNHTASHRLTPRNKVQTPAKSGREDDSLRLCLKKVIGTTASSPGAIDYLPDHRVIATCAGTVAVVSRFDEYLNITQRVFRAGPNATALNTSASFYNPGTPAGFRDIAARQSIAKDGGAGTGPSINHSELLTDSPGRTKASIRTRSTSCLSLSRNGRFLAVGETGVNPRINVFSVADDAKPDTPLSTLSGHSNFGIRSVAFSPNSRWLCSLGNINDGFIFLWHISKNGSARLHASNKCVSSIQEITWMGSNVISVGTRHVKVWRLNHAEPISPSKGRPDMTKGYDIPPSSPVPKTFPGRNCLLGSLIDAVFTSVVAISQNKAIICTEQGDICLLDDSDQNQRLEKVAHVDFKVLCVSVEISRDCVIVGGAEGKNKVLSMQNLEKLEVILNSASVPSRSDSASQHVERALSDIVAIGFLSKDECFALDASHSLCIMDLEKLKLHDPTAILKQVAAHNSAVLGVSTLLQPNKQAADFFTWSSQGTALFWTVDGSCTYKFKIPLDQEPDAENYESNELKVLRASPSADFFVFGDKHGNIGIPLKPEQIVKAHNGEVNDLSIAQRENDCTLIASCGRDRILQLFQLEVRGLSLLQTMEGEHAASVSSILFLDSGSTLLSASADRTVVIRTLASVKGQAAAFVPTRTLTLKSSPVAIAPMLGESKLLVVSTMDRQLLIFDLQTGRIIQSSKASDFGGGDSVTVSSMIVQKLNDRTFQAPLIFGVSANDRSIRAYNSSTGSLLAREYGQLAISDVAIITPSDDGESNRKLIISTGLDGTIMVWELSAASVCQPASDDITDHQNLLRQHNRSSQPLRRVLSKSELSELQQSLDQELTTPTRTHHHPSTMRKKTSRLTLANAQRQATPKALKSERSPTSSALDAGHESFRDQSHTRQAQTVTLVSRTKRSSSDAVRYHPARASKSDEGIPSAESLCRSLHAFRNRLEVSTEDLKAEIGQDLERELAQTMYAVGQKTQKSQRPSNETSATDPVDGWLARLIDERLSLRLGDNVGKK